jgi:ParB family chromosome partitioning protein
MKRKLKSTTWPIDRLKDHPLQATYFGDLSDAELDTLAQDMDDNELQDPVKILPDGTIIAGHQRVRAARRLNWTEIEVVVRTDLAKGGEAAVESYLLRDNLIRRQHSPLCRARGIRRLLEIESGCDPGELPFGKFEQLKKRIGDQLGGLHLRSVSRYLRVLEAPVAVQQALDRGELSLNNAGKLAGLFRELSEEHQQKIAGRLAEGSNASKVVDEFLRATKSQEELVNSAFRRVARVLEHELPTIRDEWHVVLPKWFYRHAGILRDSAALLTEILQWLDNHPPKSFLEEHAEEIEKTLKMVKAQGRA